MSLVRKRKIKQNLTAPELRQLLRGYLSEVETLKQKEVDVTTPAEDSPEVGTT